MRIAVIPARGGSKRIPRKNIKLFAGKPMIAYAIEAAREAHVFDRIIVSTDDSEIMHVARRYGAEVPFVRPEDLADDHTPTVPVVAHAIEEIEKTDGTVEAACCIYPCVPFLVPSDIVQGLRLLDYGDTDYSFPIAAFPAAPQRSIKLDRHGHTSPFFPEYQLIRSQDLEPAFFDAGQFYWGRRTAWLGNPRIHDCAKGLEIPGWRVVDIDTPDDWRRAEIMHLALRTNVSLHGSQLETNGEAHAV
jgi:pseudaminic acid cytidylyltransferase